MVAKRFIDGKEKIMPYVSQAQAGYFHTHKAELERQGVNVSEWDKATKGKKLPKRVRKYTKSHKKIKIKIDNKMRDFGDEVDLKGGKHVIRINKRMAKKERSQKHSKKYPELLDTIYHELHHAKHPKDSEKKTYKVTAKAIKHMTKKMKGKLYSMLP